MQRIFLLNFKIKTLHMQIKKSPQLRAEEEYMLYVII